MGMNDAEKVQDIAAKALPDIQVNDRPLRVVGQESLAALTRLNDKLAVPRLYVRGGEPVRVKRNESGELGIQDLTTDHVLYELTRAADFYRQPKKGDPEDVFPHVTWPGMYYRRPGGPCRPSRASPPSRRFVPTVAS